MFLPRWEVFVNSTCHKCATCHKKRTAREVENAGEKQLLLPPLYTYIIVKDVKECKIVKVVKVVKV